ncbi:MAG: cyclic nucleotide-binding domain-containing protein [bacterium]|nr:cyclic nucleotide-binding domain-containing protein [bacterium]
MVSISIFQDKEVFFGLSDEQLAEIALVAERKRYQPGEVLFNEGVRGDSLFIIESGEVDLTVKKGEEELKLATLPTGAVMGEMTLVNIEARSATARAVGECSAVILRNSILTGIFSRNRELFIVMLINITRILSKRLRQTTQKMMEK